MKNQSFNMLLIFALAIFTLSSCTQNRQEAAFQKMDIKSLNENAVSLFADDWFIVTAGEGEKFNPMTISWGGLGVLWGHPVATIYIRDTRFTYQFLENSNYFTLCTFDEKYRDKMDYLGTYSGRDGDKIKATGLTPVMTDLGNMYFQEARLVMECEKIYFDDLEPNNILDEKGESFYKETQSVHRMYVGKILNVWKK